MWRFSAPHAIAAFVLLAVEVFIAAFVHDQIVRPHIGDLLVVILMHFAVRAVYDAPPARVAVWVLVFAFVIEGSQAAHLIRWLGLQHSTAAKLILGDTFQWQDLVAYTRWGGAGLEGRCELV